MLKNAKQAKEESLSVQGDSYAHPCGQEANKIAEIAYFKAEGRGFAPGYELSDWLEAEQELNLSSKDKPAS